MVTTASGCARQDVGDGLGDAAQDRGAPRQHLGHAHDRQLGDRHAALQPLAPPSLAADAGKAHGAAGALP